MIKMPKLHGERSEPSVSYAKELVRAVVNHDGERRAVGRRVLFDLMGLVTPSVAVDRGGIRYYLSTSDKVVARATFGGKGFGQDTLEGAERLLERVFGRPCIRDRIFIDVGANIGTTTLPALKGFGAAGVHAFEPAPENWRLLECNLKANALSSKVVVWPLALSDRPGTAVLELSRRNSGDHRVRTGTEGSRQAFDESERTTITVPVSTLDICLSERSVPLSDVGVVWIDAQGHEGHVLTGASSVVDAGVPVVCEYWPYGLRRAGGLSTFHELVASSYTSLIDIGRSSGEEIVQLPASSVHELEHLYSGPREFTDLILVK